MFNKLLAAIGVNIKQITAPIDSNNDPSLPTDPKERAFAIVRRLHEQNRDQNDGDDLNEPLFEALDLAAQIDLPKAVDFGWKIFTSASHRTPFQRQAAEQLLKLTDALYNRDNSYHADKAVKRESDLLGKLNDYRWGDDKEANDPLILSVAQRLMDRVQNKDKWILSTVKREAAYGIAFHVSSRDPALTIEATKIAIEAERDESIRNYNEYEDEKNPLDEATSRLEQLYDQTGKHASLAEAHYLVGEALLHNAELKAFDGMRRAPHRTWTIIHSAPKGSALSLNAAEKQLDYVEVRTRLFGNYEQAAKDADKLISYLPDAHPLQTRAAQETIVYANCIRRYNPEVAEKYYWHVGFDGNENNDLTALALQAEFDGIDELEIEGNPYWSLHYAKHIAHADKAQSWMRLAAAEKSWHLMDAVAAQTDYEYYDARLGSLIGNCRIIMGSDLLAEEHAAQADTRFRTYTTMLGQRRPDMALRELEKTFTNSQYLDKPQHADLKVWIEQEIPTMREKADTMPTPTRPGDGSGVRVYSRGDGTVSIAFGSGSIL